MIILIISILIICKYKILMLIDKITKGIGYGQALSTLYVMTYYCALIAVTIFYLFSSFQSVLPWTICQPEWVASFGCYNSSSEQSTAHAVVNGSLSSSALYFR